jgi:hypothetical protein
MTAGLFRRRLRPSRLPNPLPDTHSESFWSGYWIGVVTTIGAAVIALVGGR